MEEAGEVRRLPPPRKMEEVEEVEEVEVAR